MEETTRQRKFARLMQKELSSIFQKEAKEYAAGSLLTITVVRVTPDLGLAKIYLSFFPEDKSGEKLAKLQQDKAIIKKILGNKIRNEVRVIPDIAFFVDDTYEEVSQMDSLIKSLNIPKEDKEESQ
ncbi:MAG: 30S ribosome-binding factor RbfA [Cytophagales bacterium]|nr:MAG: 30S ribosome-binding factor RbfA [Cytophagales bacterium]